MDKTKVAVEIFNKLAKEYQEKFMNVDAYAPGLDFFCRQIKKEGAEILELACGPGNITRYLLNKRPDFKILGIDLAPNMVSLARINNPTARFEVMDCKTIGSLEKAYDALMCGFCLPYLSKEDALKLIKDAAQLLKPGGVLYLSTMEDDYSKSGLKKGSSGDEMFMHYHEGGYLLKAFKENDFVILDLQRQDYHEKDGSKTTDLVIIAAKSKG